MTCYHVYCNTYRIYKLCRHYTLHASLPLSLPYFVITSRKTTWALKWSCLPLSPVCLPWCGGWVLVGVAASKTKTFRNQKHRFQSNFAYCKLFGVYAGVIPPGKFTNLPGPVSKPWPGPWAWPNGDACVECRVCWMVGNPFEQWKKCPKGCSGYMGDEILHS